MQIPLGHIKERKRGSRSQHIIHLMSDPERNSWFCFPESPDVSQDEVEGSNRTRGKTKLTGFRKGPDIKCIIC